MNGPARGNRRRDPDATGEGAGGGEGMAVASGGTDPENQGAEPAQIVADYWKWTRKRANQLHGPYVDGRGNDPEDLQQEALIELWRQIERFDRSKGSMPYWLTKKAEGRMKDLLRHREKWQQNVELKFDKSATYSGPEEEPVNPEMAAAVRKALDVLSPREREYVDLRFWQGYGTTALIRHFGYDPRPFWARAKKKLTAELEGVMA